MTRTHQRRPDRHRSSWGVPIPTRGSTSASSSTSIRDPSMHTRRRPQRRRARRRSPPAGGGQLDRPTGGPLSPQDEIGLVDIAHAEQRPRRAGDRRARGGQARRLREAARRHARRRRGDGRRGGDRAGSDLRLVQLPAASRPSPSPTSWSPTARSAGSTTSAPPTCRVGAVPTRRCCGASRATSPGRARTATSTPTSSTWSGSSPARRSSRSRERSSTRSSPNAPCSPRARAARSPDRRAPTEAAGPGASTVDDAVVFLARLSGGGIARFEATRLATGYHNANRFEIHGERGALRFDFERMNELGLLRRHRRRRDCRAGRRSTSPAAATAIRTPRRGGPTATASATSTASSTRPPTSSPIDRRRRPRSSPLPDFADALADPARARTRPSNPPAPGTPSTSHPPPTTERSQ